MAKTKKRSAPRHNRRPQRASSARGPSLRGVALGSRHLPSQPPVPTQRYLRGYAFDPSLATQLETALVPSDCFYAPVDLDHPAVLAQQGLTPSEGNPQFHQQMVYAAAMTTINRFEQSPGRKAFWTDRFVRGATEPSDEFVQRLRLYPHAMRMANAYYSRNRGGLLFGYFPATDDRTSGQFPGGMVFTCLSHACRSI